VLGPERFNTLLGIIFLIIVLVSPGGLVGAWESGIDRLRRRRQRGGAPPTTSTMGPEGGPAPTTVK
jgi:branched-chain amino acid transport system permease protein